MTILVDQYLATLGTLASRRAARSDLANLARWWDAHRDRAFDPASLAHRDVVAWVRYRQETEERKPTTINRGLSTVRQFGAWLVASGVVRENPASGVRDLPVEPRGPRALPDDAVDAVLRAAQTEPNLVLRLRDNALLALLAYAGLRSQEACDVQLRDLDLDGGSLVVRRGKGGKARRVPLHSAAVALLRRYVREVRCPAGLPAVGSAGEREPLLVTVHVTRAGRPQQPGMSTRTVRARIGQLCGRAAAQLRAAAEHEPRLARVGQFLQLAAQLDTASPHVFRHSLARRMLRSGADLSEVQRVLGHTRLGTTGIYTVPSDDELREAVERAGV